MRAAGFGCRREVSVDDVVAAFDATLAALALRQDDVGCVAAPAFKRDQAVLALAFARIGLPVVHLDDASLQAASPHALTISRRVLDQFGVPSVAETAALAAAGADARLLAPRLVLRGVTCAIAESPASERPA